MDGDGRKSRLSERRASVRLCCSFNIKAFYAALAAAARLPPLSSLSAGQNGLVLNKNVCCAVAVRLVGI